MKFRYKISMLLVIVAYQAGWSGYARAQAVPEPTLDSYLKKSRREAMVEPPANVDPVFLISAPNDKPPEIAEEEKENHGFSMNLTASYPLQTGSASGSGLGSQGTEAVSPTLQMNLKYNPISYWFGQIAFYRYLFADRKQSWDPDFSYSFGYDDWHLDTFSAVYSNYGGNRLSPDSEKGEKRTAFNQGQWSFGYKFALPQPLESLFLVGDGDQTGCSANLNITPRYNDLKSVSLRRYKKSLALGCRYTRPSGWYANVTLFAYPDRSQQQPWDPDFTYGFGYFDSRPGTISVQYNNSSGNRFPWHERAPGSGSLGKGGISVSWSTAW